MGGHGARPLNPFKLIMGVSLGNPAIKFFGCICWTFSKFINLDIRLGDFIHYLLNKPIMDSIFSESNSLLKSLSSAD